jgi:hypothetical protein
LAEPNDHSLIDLGQTVVRDLGVFFRIISKKYTILANATLAVGLSFFAPIESAPIALCRRGVDVMAIFEELFKRSVVTGIAVGVGAALLAPVLLPAVARLARPLMKAAIRSGIIFYEKGRETVAELGEVVEDIVAEAQAEISEPEAAAGAVAAGVAAKPGPRRRRAKRPARPETEQTPQKPETEETSQERVEE